MLKESEFQKVNSRLEALTDEMIEFQKNITAIPALGPESGGEGEWDKAMFIKDYLRNLGVEDLQQIDAPDPRAKNGKRPNLIARLKGKSSQKTIWIMAHMDVVPEGDLELWETDPWQAVVKDGKIFGRGTEDNQQGLTSAVFVLRAFLEEKIKPVYDLALLLAADEETGSKYGLEYVLENHPELFKPEDLIIVPDAGNPDGSMIEVAEKSIAWLRFITKGKQCHGSEPEKGINAFKAASHLIVELGNLYKKFEVADDLFSPPISTFEPTKKEANVPNINTIPGEDIFYMDCRILPRYSVNEVLEEIRSACHKIEEQFGVTINLEFPQISEAAPPTPPDSEVVRKLKTAVQAIYHVEAKPMGIGGGTVAAIFRRAGLNAAVWSTLDDVCHQPNEYAVISNMVNDAIVFAHVCLQE